MKTLLQVAARDVVSWRDQKQTILAIMMWALGKSAVTVTETDTGLTIEMPFHNAFKTMDTLLNYFHKREEDLPIRMALLLEAKNAN